MVKFNERNKPQTTLKVRENRVPSVYISETALNKMAIYVDEAPGQDEIGWLGTAYRENNEFFIEDVFLFKQEVHGTTTEITTEGLNDFAQELLMLPNGVDIWNNIKMWGHSHVNMGISPSGQDNSQMEAFSNIGHDFFIRLICNKKGELAVDVYLYDEGLEFHNAPWVIQHEAEDTVADLIYSEMDELETKLVELKNELNKHQEAKVDAIKAPIKAEIAQKVSKLVYNTPKVGKNYYANYTKSKLGYTDSSYDNDVYDPTIYDAKNFAPTDMIDGVKFTVHDYYSQHDLNLLANTCFSLGDFIEDAKLDGMDTMLSLNDMKAIWEKILDIQDATYQYNPYGNFY